MDITEGIRKIFLAGVGAVATTGEAAKSLIDTLVEKGELTVEQGKALNEELKKNAKEKMNRHVTVHVVNEFRDVYSAVDKMSREELESLKERLNELTAEKDEASEDMSQETTQDMTASRATVDGEENPDNSAES
ncbi:MAG TPA: phasin family protein [Candidatus Eisenbergiella stercoravium]|nr:phasin family protein [Candidatus Eisenbergiella stercoravium]